MRCPRPDALLARIAALDAQLNAFLLPTPEKAREQACVGSCVALLGLNLLGLEIKTKLGLP